MAEVSRATVDRVIHGRGTVSPKTYARIQRILDKIDFQPNLIAQTLKKGEVYKVAILVPDYTRDVYWKRAFYGFDDALADYSFIGIRVDKYMFNLRKEVSFVLNARKILNGGYNGVVAAPVFYQESIDFFRSCEEMGLPYVTFNTHIKESQALCHVGQDLVQSGRTAASLLHRVCKPERRMLVLHMLEDHANARHLKEKEEGFREFFRENGFSEDKVIVERIDNTLETEQRLMATLENQPSVGAIYVSTSKVHFVAEVLQAYDLDIRLLGYDLIDENTAYLEQGIIDYLIYQNPRFQANQALSSLVDHLAFKKQLSKLKLLPIELVIKENLENYMP
ncbi:MAG: hypothetical protein CSA96_00585 [Bacteroidetes bacterium]|nr:MAG: hypothetical protein CSA96_00585 [Bacteroidota bacterium]